MHVVTEMYLGVDMHSYCRDRQSVIRTRCLLCKSKLYDRNVFETKLYKMQDFYTHNSYKYRIPKYVYSQMT